MSKKLNEEAMASELAGSAFFQPASPRSAHEPAAQEPLPESSVLLTVPPAPGTDVRSPSSTLETPPEGPHVRTPGRRVITRYAFEFYQDQIEQLRRTSLQQKLQGEPGSMSEMVREALDAYLIRREDSAA